MGKPCRKWFFNVTCFWCHFLRQTEETLGNQSLSHISSCLVFPHLAWVEADDQRSHGQVRVRRGRKHGELIWGVRGRKGVEEELATQPTRAIRTEAVEGVAGQHSEITSKINRRCMANGMRNGESVRVPAGSVEEVETN